MNHRTTTFLAIISFLICSFQSLAQDDVLILYNDTWGSNGTFNCVQSYAGADGNFTLCPIGNGSGLSAPGCAVNLCNYDIVMVQATYSDLNAAFISLLITYLQCGGNLYFQNDIGSISSPAPQQNMNDLLTAIGQPSITLTADLGTYQNQQPIINTGTSGIQNLCSISPLTYNSGGMLGGPGLANAATVNIPQGTIAAFWQTPWGGVLGLGGEFYTSGNWSGTCLPGSGEMVWGFMTNIAPGCATVLADFTLSNDTICTNAPLDLTDVSLADSIVSWDWSFTSGTPATSNLQHPVGITWASAGIYDITLTVTDSSGTADDTTMQVVVTNCLPPVASFSVSSDTLCLGDQLTVNDLSTSVSPITNWGWTFNGGTPAISNLQSPGPINYASAGTYDINLTVTNGFGSDDTTITIVVLDCSLPVSIFSFPNDTICEGDCFALTDLSTSSNSIVSWDWTMVGATPTSSTDQNPLSICYANPGTYDITLSVTDSLGGVDDTTMQIVVANCLPPIASFSISSDTICLGDQLIVNDGSSSVSPITDWDWTFNGGTPATSNVQSPGPIDYATAGTYDIMLTVTNNYGSDDTTIAVVVIDCSTPQAIFSIPNDTICQGDCFALTDLSGSPNPITNWDWTMVGANPASSTSQNPTNVCYTNPGTFDIILAITDSSGLTDDTTLQIVVQNCVPPIASFSVIDTICSMNPVNLTDLSTSTTPILSWDWAFNGGTPTTSSQQNPGVITYANAGTYDITLTVTNAHGSDDTTLSIVVVDCLPFVANFSFSPDTLCPGGCITFTDLSTSQEPITSWSWNFSGGTPSSSDLQNPGTVCFENSGIHPVTLTIYSVNGSHDTTFNVFVQNPPLANFGINPNNPVIDEMVTFTDQSTGGVNLIWNINGVSYSSSTVTQTYSESGTYPVSLIVTSSAGCTDTLIRELVVVEDLIYYVPNAFTPNGDEHNNIFKPIFTSGFDPQDYTLQIFNRWGELIFISHDYETGWDGTYLAGQLVQNGVYTWVIEFKMLLNDERKVITGHVNVLK